MKAARSPWRLVDSGIISPETSAASDEAIVNARADGDVPDTVHFYVRDSPTVSIGYNRSVEESVFADEAERRGVKIIRRFSGGSAVYTDSGQLIFALILSSSLLPNDVVESYRVICGAVVGALSSLGISAEHKPINDILVGGKKVSGSAQLRRRGVVLHHGTLIVDADLDAIQSVLRPSEEHAGHRPMTSLSQILGHPPEMKALKHAIVESLAERFGVSIRNGEMTDRETGEIDRLIDEKYGSREWNWKL